MPDLFDPVVPPEKLNLLFSNLIDGRGRAPARSTLQNAFDQLPKPDGNFIKDFQTTGFSARVWELYLAAYATSIGLHLTQPDDRPDYLLTKAGASVWLEATTANPTDGEEPHGASPISNWELGNEFLVKLGSALYSKLTKRYWQLPHVAGLPFVIALADFHDNDPLRASSGPLSRYLYGTHLLLTSGPGEPVKGVDHPVPSIHSSRKTIPGHFFELPETEHISAILFSNAGTIGKFDRMGFDRHLHSDMRMLRWGYAFDSEITAVAPEPFAYVVGDAPETWGQEVIVFHNPHALHPVPDKFFGDALQMKSIDGKLFHTHIDFHPLTSLTETYVGTPATMAQLEPEIRARARRLVIGLKARHDALEGAIIKEHREWIPGF